MTKHTPGPWRAEPHSLHEISFLITSKAPQSVGGDRTVTVAKFASQADASLIAAAPELLAVAKIFAEYLANNGGDEHYHNADGTGWLTIARAAIAKATAGSP